MLAGEGSPSRNKGFAGVFVVVIKSDSLVMQRKPATQARVLCRTSKGKKVTKVIRHYRKSKIKGIIRLFDYFGFLSGFSAVGLFLRSVIIAGSNCASLFGYKA